MKDTDLIKKIVDYIENHLDSQLRLDDIAAKVSYSRFHLNRVFSENVGCTIHKYIQMRRLTVAAEKLIYTKKHIVEIALEANYNSQQSFSFAFRQLYGYPPQIYRAMRIYSPKLNRFSPDSKLAMFRQIAMRCEGLAA